ncbi:hypothetical protein D3C85_1902350 [compost metagenome]
MREPSSKLALLAHHSCDSLHLGYHAFLHIHYFIEGICHLASDACMIVRHSIGEIPLLERH